MGRMTIKSTLFVLILLASCNDLPLRTEVQLRVEAYVQSVNPAPRFALYDGTTRIGSGGTAALPDTIFGVPVAGTLTIKNEGNLDLNLLGAPNIVAVTGGSGQAAYTVSQPLQITLAAGQATAFNITFTPPAPDTDYPCTLVINSDDPANPAFAFNAAGHATQWHGSSKVVGTTAAANIFNPRLAIDGSTVYLSYTPPAADTNAIGIKQSTDGGKTWSAFGTGQAAAAPYPHALQAVSGAPHLFYYNSAGTTVHYWKWLNAAWHSVDSATGTSVTANGELNGTILVSGMVFLAWYDSSVSRLKYNYSMNPQWQSVPGIVIESFLATPLNLTNNAGWTGPGGQYPSMQRDSAGNLYILYADTTNNRIMLIQAANNNLDFAGNPNLYTGPATNPITGCALVLTEVGSTVIVHAVWSELANTNNLYYSRTTSADFTAWTTQSLGVNNWRAKNFQFAAGSGGKLYLLHKCNTGTTGIVLTTSSDGGNTWSSQTIDADPSFTSGADYPAAMGLAVSGSAVFAAYSTDGAAGNAHPNGYSITLKKSINGGVSW